MHDRLRRVLGSLTALAVVTTGTVALDVPAAQAAYAMPAVPRGLPAALEVAQPYVGQSSCDPVAKPGVAAFRNLLLRTYPDSGSLGIVRDCGIGGESEHKEGRAFDWAMNAHNARQAHEVAAVLSWLTRTDANGNTAAMARRLGIMYMIWNRQIWRIYDQGRGWTPYSGESAHTDHVHFSFGWNGARKVTSFWDKTVAPIDFGPHAPPHVTPVPSVGNLAVIRSYGDTALAMHSSGAAVLAMQKALHVSGADGVFGSDTGRYVDRFQADQNLPITQRFGPAEWKALFPFPTAPFGTVDTPTYALGNAVVQGWTIDADTTGAVDVSVLVDGSEAQRMAATAPRDDVARDYPEYGGEHGFSVAVPILDGSHEVCVVAHNVDGTPGADTSLGCATVSPLHDPLGALDEVASALGVVTVRGWALDPDTTDAVTTALTVDGAPSGVTPSPATRTDIGQRYPGIGDNHGIELTLTLPAGSHELCLDATNASGTPGADVTVDCRTVVVEHTPVGALDVARRAPGGVLVRGWALDPDSTSATTVDLRSDGTLVQPVSARLTRTALLSTYPAQGTEHGFSVLLDLPVGRHSVCATVHNIAGTPGADRALPCRTVTVTHDVATTVSTFGTVPGGAVLVAGDAYDPDTLDPVSVTVTLDGTPLSAYAARVSTTSAARWPGYGGSRGFALALHPAAGRHTVCLSVANAAGTPGVGQDLGCRTVTVHDATGALTSLGLTGRTATVSGWTVDPDTTLPTPAVLVVDGHAVLTALASRARTGMPAGYGALHGVSFVRALTPGTHRVCLLARNVAGTLGASRFVGCRTVTVT